MWDHAAGSHTVVEAHPSLVVRILAPFQEVLIPHVVGPLIDHPAPTLHLDGVAAAEVGVQVSTVAAALMGAALEVPVLKEDYLQKNGWNRLEHDMLMSIKPTLFSLLQYILEAQTTGYLYHRCHCSCEAKQFGRICGGTKDLSSKTTCFTFPIVLAKCGHTATLSGQPGPFISSWNTHIVMVIN